MPLIQHTYTQLQRGRFPALIRLKYTSYTLYALYTLYTLYSLYTQILDLDQDDTFDRGEVCMEYRTSKLYVSLPIEAILGVTKRSNALEDQKSFRYGVYRGRECVSCV